jgi:EAL and modified HD-GYP domain-containing signal transduction protein
LNLASATLSHSPIAYALLLSLIAGTVALIWRARQWSFSRPPAEGTLDQSPSTIQLASARQSNLADAKSRRAAAVSATETLGHRPVALSRRRLAPNARSEMPASPAITQSQSPPAVFVARQPILDRQRRLHAYDLRFRPGPASGPPESREGHASRNAIGHALTTFALDDLVSSNRAHLRVDRSLLVDQAPLALSPDKVVFEIAGSLPPDDEVLAACLALKRAGYHFAVSDVAELLPGHPVLALADVIRVDLRGTDASQRQAIARANAARHYHLLADNVDTLEEFAEAKGLGFDFFQGHFFQQPVIVARQSIPSARLASLQLVRELNQADVDWQRLEQAIKQDVGLPIKLLRCLNSAWFGLPQPVESLRHAMIMLGISGLRQ